MGDKKTERVTFVDVREAYERIKSVVSKTPVFQDEDFNEKYGRNFYFKAENMQKTGAFKIRGALNAVLKLREKEKDIKGLVTHSSGNHGRAMAWIARRFHLPCVVVCPTTVPEAKLQDIRDLGTEIVPCEPTPADRLRKVGQVQEERGYKYISTCDDNDVIAGQGTIGLELLDQVPDLDAILVPVSGGGMAAGICIAAKSIKQDTKIFIVEPEGKDLEKCLKAGERLWPNPPKCLDTVADGMRMQQLGFKTWPIVLEHAEKQVFTVADKEAIEGMKYAFQSMKNKSLIRWGFQADKENGPLLTTERRTRLFSPKRSPVNTSTPWKAFYNKKTDSIKNIAM
ncbi:probable serine racemase [Mercenaria mercenaria]|uniref:probable serine racemase n=1 Tax=Mercenaria mercenaria TaxID=6596 RepID=UPI00234E46A2|nr:probable serine racemase [Mercenaria mercenaria]